MATKRAKQLDWDDLGSKLTRTDSSGNKTTGDLESVSAGSWGVQIRYGEYMVSLQPEDEVTLS